MAPSHGIRIRDVRKAYGSVVARSTSTSGPGKTTLLMIIAGFIRPDRGSVEVGGRPPW